MKLLITGATGFVGASLVHNFVKDFDVSILTRKTSGTWRIDAIADKIHNVEYADIADRTAVFAAVSKIKPEVIIHVATYGGFSSETETKKMINANIVGTKNLLDAAVFEGVAKFINTGSSSEYGIKNCPMNENDVCAPVNFYGITKLAATNYCSMVGHSQKHPVCTLRLFSPYGDLEADSRLYASIVKSIKVDKQPHLANPCSVRDFINIDKVVAIYRAMLTVDIPYGEIVNIGSGKQQTVEQFYYSVAKQFDKAHIKPLWGHAPSRSSEPQYWQADITRLRQILSDNNYDFDRL